MHDKIDISINTKILLSKTSYKCKQDIIKQSLYIQINLNLFNRTIY